MRKRRDSRNKGLNGRKAREEEKHKEEKNTKEQETWENLV